MTHKLLFVDDEINVLKGLKRLFFGTEYEVYIESDCSKALEILKSNRISVLVSDMRMPGMNGVSLIKMANDIDSFCIKIILSGYSDIDDIMSAVNEGHIYSYITKPWHEASLKLLISNACGLYESKAKEKILLRKLREKQKELIEINKTLEQKVAERTGEISEINSILNRIISGDPEELIFTQIAGNLSAVCGNTLAAVYSSEDKKFFYSEPGCADVFRQLKNSLDRSESAIESDIYFSLPVRKGNDILGAVVFLRKDGIDIKSLIPRFSSFVSAAMLYLSQKKLVNSSVDFADSIDSIIGDLEDE